MADEEDILAGLSEEEKDALAAEELAVEGTPEPIAPDYTDDPQIGANERLTINNLFEKNPRSQLDYLETRGYDARERAGRVEASLPGAGMYGPVEPGPNAKLGFFGSIKEGLLDIGDGANDVLGMAVGAKTMIPGLGLGQIAQNTVAGAASQGIVDGALNAYGGRILGLPKRGLMEDAGISATQGALEGGIGGLAGGIFGRWLGAPPEVRKDGAMRLIKNAFGLSDQQLGQATITGAEREIAQIANPQAYDDAFLDIMNPVDEVVTALHDKFDMVTPLRTSGTPVEDLAKNIVVKAGQVGGNLETTVKAISKDPNSKIKLSEIRKFFFGNKDEYTRILKEGGQPPPLDGGAALRVKQANKIADEMGGDLNPTQASAVEGKINEYLRNLKKLTAAEPNEKELARMTEYDTLIKGGKVKGPKGVDETLKPLDVVKAERDEYLAKIAKTKNGRLNAKHQKRFQGILDDIADREARIAQIEPEVVKIRAQMEDPDITFQQLDDWKKNTYATIEAELLKLRGDPIGGAINQARGELSDFMGGVASRTPFGPEFSTLSKDYSLLKDAAKLALKGAGAEGKLRNTDAPYLFGELGHKIAPAIPWIGKKVGPATIGARVASDPDNAKNLFLEAARMLPPSQAAGNAGVLQSLSAKLQSGLASNAGPMVQVSVGRGISNLVASSLNSAHASELDTLEKGVIMNMLQEGGIITPEQKQNGFNFMELPPDIQQQVTEAAKQAIAPLRDAVLFGGEEEIGAAYSQVAKMYPDMFPAPKTGIKGEVEVGGKIKLYDPMDRARYAAKIQNDDSIDWGKKADIVSDLNEKFIAGVP